jgi:hypothetical protein
MWIVGFILGAAVVLVVAALLIAILLVARNIERLAGQALGVAGEIVAVTRPVWALGDVNDIVEEIATAVRSIESQVTALADQLAPEG